MSIAQPGQRSTRSARRGTAVYFSIYESIALRTRPERSTALINERQRPSYLILAIDCGDFVDTGEKGKVHKAKQASRILYKCTHEMHDLIQKNVYTDRTTMQLLLLFSSLPIGRVYITLWCLTPGPFPRQLNPSIISR